MSYDRTMSLPLFLRGGRGSSNQIVCRERFDCVLSPRRSGRVGLCLSLTLLAGLTSTLCPTAHGAPTFTPVGSVGVVRDFALTEASGLVASRQNSGVLWIHNDSAGAGSVYAVATNGAILGRYFSQFSIRGDYEDIAVGPGPVPGRHYLYVGDIGDNLSNRSFIRVVRFPEPVVYPDQTLTDGFVNDSQALTLTYSDGPGNAEAMMVDPVTGDLFVVKKLQDSARVYRATQQELNSGGSVTLHFVRTLTFPRVSGSDISADGRMIVLRRGNNASIWVRGSGQSVGDALGGSPIAVPIVGAPTEPNGEAIGFYASGLGYYTISEGANPPLFAFRRTDASGPRQPATLIGTGELWRYQDRGSDEGTAWKEPEFDDSRWPSGATQLGFGEGDERTLASGRSVTTYFRKTFVLRPSMPLQHLLLRLCYNDGVAVYLNGAEAFRHNLAPNAGFGQVADASNAPQPNLWDGVAIDPALLRIGTNTLAVELHSAQPTPTRLSFDLQLLLGAFDLNPVGVSSDVTAPSVTITVPPRDLVVTNTSLHIQGTARDSQGLARILWAVRGNSFQTAVGTTNWMAEVPLAVGTNVVMALAYDRATNASTLATRTIVRMATSPLTVEVLGLGRVTPDLSGANLVIGKGYTLTAVPAVGHLFAGWSGGMTSAMPMLRFAMESNLSVQARFVPNPFPSRKGTYQGLFSDTNQPAHENSGALSLTLTERGSYTATLRVAGRAVAWTGQFDPFGVTTRRLILPDRSSVTATLILDTTSSVGQLTGEIAGTNGVWPLRAYRTVAASASQPSPFAGRYTLSLHASNPASGPVGHSVANVAVSPSGTMTLSATLADGSKVLQAAGLAEGGRWPLYQALYQQRGSISGWFAVTNTAGDRLRGVVRWSKPVSPRDSLYPQGFNQVLGSQSSSYSTAAMTSFLTTNRQWCWTINGLSLEPQTNCPAHTARNTLNGDGFRAMTLDSVTGLWSGSFTNPLTRQALSSKLLFHLEIGTGAGYLLGPQQSGALERVLQP